METIRATDVVRTSPLGIMPIPNEPSVRRISDQVTGSDRDRVLPSQIEGSPPVFRIFRTKVVMMVTNTIPMKTVRILMIFMTDTISSDL